MLIPNIPTSSAESPLLKSTYSKQSIGTVQVGQRFLMMKSVKRKRKRKTTLSLLLFPRLDATSLHTMVGHTVDYSHSSAISDRLKTQSVELGVMGRRHCALLGISNRVYQILADDARTATTRLVWNGCNNVGLRSLKVLLRWGLLLCRQHSLQLK